MKTSTFVLYISILCFFTTLTHANEVGLTPSSFRVDETGAATYQLPIKVPAGTAGVTPQISLSYSSNNLSEGAVGVGWSISGSSAISRCPKTPFFDNEIREVTFDSQDPFCLDGQRLILDSGTHGQVDATYRTATDAFRYITIKEAHATYGPILFEIKNKAGETHYYGDVSSIIGDQIRSSEDLDYTDAYHVLGGMSNVAQAWALKAIVDVKKNYIVYHYANNSDGSFYLDQINYTGTHVSDTYAEIHFKYDPYDKGAKGFMGGGHFAHTELLTEIIVKIKDEIFRSYALTYEGSGFNNTSNIIEERVMLTSVQECAGENKDICLPPTTIEWQRPALASTTTTMNCFWEPEIGEICLPGSSTTDYTPFPNQDSIASNTDNEHTTSVIDINGDGYSDLIYVKGLQWKVRLGPDFNSESYLTSIGDTKKEYALNIDYNGDGVRDLLVADSEASNWHAVSYLPSIMTQEVCDPWDECEDFTYQSDRTEIDLGIKAVGMEGDALVLDVDGDGMEDIVYMSGSNIKAYLNENGSFSGSTVLYSFSSGTGGSMTDDYVRQSATLQAASAFDFNGDGRSDLIMKVTTTSGGCYYYGSLIPGMDQYSCQNMPGVWAQTTTTNYKLFQSSGSYTSPTLSMVQDIGSSSLIDTVRVADLNGDGLSDVVFEKNNKWHYRLSDGTQLLSPHESTIVTGDSRKELSQFVDLNGDGRADILNAITTGNWEIYFSRPGAGTSSLILEGRGYLGFGTNSAVRFGDTNGDGNLELLTGKDGDWTEYAGDSFKKYVVKKIVNGHGVETNIGYGPLTDPIVYPMQRSDFNVSTDTISPISGMQVVTSVSTEANTNTFQQVLYSYGGLLIHKKGLGHLGFQKLKTGHIQSGVVTETQYNQSHSESDYTLARLPLYTEQSRNGKLISQALNTLDNIETVSKADTHLKGASFPFIASTIEKQYIYDSNEASTLASTTTTSSDYDGWGNLTESIITIADEYSQKSIKTTTNNLYGSTDDDKKLARLSETTVTKEYVGENDAKTRKTKFEYDSDGLLKKSILSPDIAATKLTTIYDYDSFGNQDYVSVTGFSTSTGASQTRTTESTYLFNGRLLGTVQDALGDVTTYVYNSSSLEPGIILTRKTTDPNGHSITEKLDELGRVYEITQDNQKKSTIDWEYVFDTANGNEYYSTTYTTTGVPDKVVVFDAWGREIESRVRSFDGGWVVAEKTYDAQGRLDKVYEPGSTTEYTQTSYDVLSRITSITLPNSNTVSTSIDGFEITETNGLNHIMTKTVNGFGQTVLSEGELNTKVAYTFDAWGNLQSTIINNDSLTTVSMTYDDWGRKKQTIDPSKGTWNYEYNAFGELFSQKNAKLQTTKFYYDLLGRKIRSHEPSEGTLCWNYGSGALAEANAKGKLQSMAKYEGVNVACNVTTTPTYKKSYSYENTVGLLAQESTQFNGKSFTKSFSYDGFSRVDTIDYNNHSKLLSIDYVYNAQNYLHEIKEENQADPLKTIVSHNSRGQINAVNYKNGVSSALTYGTDTGWLDSVSISNTPNGLLNFIDMTYDVIGNVTAKQIDYTPDIQNDLKYTETYQYDRLNRLKSRDITIGTGISQLPSYFSASATQSFQYDMLGNLYYKHGSGYYKYNSSNPYQLDGTYDDFTFQTQQTNGFSYDANGNMLTDWDRTFTYSSFDKVTQISKTGGITSTMKYDTGRNMYFKQDAYQENGNNVTYKRSYIGDMELVERTGGAQGALTEYKFYIDDVVITKRSASTDYYYLHKDHLGSVVATTDGSGSVVSQSIYDPWGKRSDVYLDSDFGGFSYSLPTDRGYTGHKHLDSLGIIQMNGRIYDPTLGRFLQADPFIQAPLNSQNYNRYSYVLNNPLSYTDPSGYFFKSLWKGVKSAFRAIAKVPILNAALQFAACSFGGPAGCAAYAAISTYAVTGSLKGALIGAFTAGIGGGQGFFTVGLIGGLASRAQGGNFGHGFWSAGLGALLGGRIKLGNPYANVLVSAVVGGTISKITGGKFSNGAQTWAFSAAIAQDWNDDFGTSSYEKIEEELANLTDEQKDSNFKRNYESFKRGIEAVGEALGLETPDNIVVVGMDDIDGNLAAVECSVFLGCLNQVKVSREFLQLNRTSYDFLETAYHEVLHFNDTRWNIFLNSDSRHNQIIRQSEMVHFVTPRWVEQGIHGANEALRVRTQFERIENN